MKFRIVMSMGMLVALGSVSLAGAIEDNKPDGKAQSTKPLALDGVVMSMPTNWKSLPVPSGGPMSPKAILTIPGEKGESASIRITHFPRMKGMNDANVQRWLGQTKRADGSAATKKDAKIETVKLKGVELTIVDLNGTIKATMRDAAKPNQRMIAAIVDHAQGPHFVVAVGDAELMRKSEKSVRRFFESASPR